MSLHIIEGLYTGAANFELCGLYGTDAMQIEMAASGADSPGYSPTSGSHFWWETQRATCAGDWSTHGPLKSSQTSSGGSIQPQCQISMDWQSYTVTQEAHWQLRSSGAGIPSAAAGIADHIAVHCEPMDVDLAVHRPSSEDVYMSTSEGSRTKRARPSEFDENIEELHPARRMQKARIFVHKEPIRTFRPKLAANILPPKKAIKVPQPKMSSRRESNASQASYDQAMATHAPSWGAWWRRICESAMDAMELCCY